jgi:uncharacterized damage-inducible protein DinB
MNPRPLPGRDSDTVFDWRGRATSRHYVPMTWIAPQTKRTEAPTIGDERTLLQTWLDFHRETLLHKCAGLTAAQLTLRSAAPSGLSLLGLVRHMADVERAWFRIRFAGEPLGPLYYNAETNPDGDFDDVDPAHAERDFETFAQEVASARAAAARRSLEETFYHAYRKGDVSLRWIYLHMIEEYARHNGHADLIRERIDGATGD